MSRREESADLSARFGGSTFCHPGRWCMSNTRSLRDCTTRRSKKVH